MLLHFYMGGGSLIDSIAIYGPKFIAVTILAVVFVIKELFFVNIGRTFTHVWELNLDLCIADGLDKTS